MGKTKKTGNLVNVVVTDNDNNVTLPKALTLGEVPPIDDDSLKVPTTSWVNDKLSTGGVPYEGAVADVDLGDNSLIAESVILGGASNQFLKGDGSLDSNVYALASALHDPVTLGTPNGLSLIGQQLSLSLASSINQGALSASDWSLFSGKQNAITLTTTGSSGAATLVSSTLNIPTYTLAGLGGQTQLNGTGFVKVSGTTVSYDNNTYLTTISGITAGGELTGTYPNPTLVTSAVTSKLLSGVNITGGTVTATDSILVAFGKLQNQINGLIGGSIYQGTWNASTNTPSLVSSTGTNGHYYIVNVAGSTSLNGITDWKVGDWAIFNGGVWQKVDNTDAVVSVNGFTGAVSLTTSNITEGTNLYFTNARARAALSLTTSGTSGAATYDNGTGVLNIPNYGSALSGYLPLTGGTLTSSGSANTLNINHTSGSGIALNITKSGNGEALTIVKGSGSGNAASITGGITLLSELNLTTKLADAHINSAATWNAKIGGSGTTNYLAKFTASGAVGDSLIYDNGTNVSIGGDIFVNSGIVRGGTSANDYGSLTLSGGYNVITASRSRIEIRGYEDGAATQNAIISYANGVEAMRITSGGNVLIGTTTDAGYKLDVNGTSVIRGVATFGSSINIIDNNVLNLGSNQGGGATLKYNSNGNLDITPRAGYSTIFTAGNVGIGTTSPTQKLDVNGLINSTNGISVGGSGVSVVWTGTQAAYDAIATKSSTTIYFIQ